MLSEKFTLGIDIGGTNLRLALTDEKGTVSAFEKHPSSEISGEDAVSRLGSAIEAYLEAHGVSDKLVSVCIGFPAAVDKAKKTVLNAPNLNGYDGMPVGEILTKKMGIPVYIEKDVNLLLLGDLKSMDIGCENAAAVYVGTGIGNAFMIDGKLISGASGVAGELGHIPFGDSESVCGCGNLGCAEALCGGVYLARLREENFPETEMSKLFVCHGEHPLLREYTRRLARVIAAEINIIDPELLLLGGGVIEMEGFPKARFESEIMAHVRKPLPHDALKIAYSPSSNGKSGVIGAGIMAWRKAEF